MEVVMSDKPICAVSTPPGVGGIAVVRISGAEAIEVVDKIWRGKSLLTGESHTAHYGDILDAAGGILDSGVATIFRAPRSYTGENTVELSIHGSRYIQQQLINTLVNVGCRVAEPGEFTKRAFANGNLDLASAEAVADMIASESKAAHAIAVRQMKGDYSKRLEELRSKLLDLASLLELELDFSEEDVEFASRKVLLDTACQVKDTVSTLVDSFKKGSAIKNGVPVAIVGDPNAGKSTLLNALIAEERALVSPISGTTRDTIEETIDIDGIRFRLIDTAGLRETDDTIERLGIERAKEKIAGAATVIWLVDGEKLSGANQGYIDQLLRQKEDIKYSMHPESKLIGVVNKIELFTGEIPDVLQIDCEISAKEHNGIEELKNALVEEARKGVPEETALVVTNARHYESLLMAAESLQAVIEGLQSGISGDFIAQDLRQVNHHLGAITGAITTTEILSTVFSRFCIGK
ncbi:MAG: tRNA uridine-5-carboxymethylaminomethyl(34) synthesis GTPase MnmE [Paramuribaculum sp.]|nr:tRNA uridine-5-carboxymethylaminomethyl(34) synthesis GTPase MnmE [Paramuribaculum sp.]